MGRWVAQQDTTVEDTLALAQQDTSVEDRLGCSGSTADKGLAAAAAQGKKAWGMMVVVGMWVKRHRKEAARAAPARWECMAHKMAPLWSSDPPPPCAQMNRRL
jgi:hypothetical protein